VITQQDINKLNLQQLPVKSAQVKLLVVENVILIKLYVKLAKLGIEILILVLLLLALSVLVIVPNVIVLVLQVLKNVLKPKMDFMLMQPSLLLNALIMLPNVRSMEQQ